jgi:hypothetical protein
MVEVERIPFSGGGLWAVGTAGTDKPATNRPQLARLRRCNMEYSEGWIAARKRVFDRLFHMKHASKRRIGVYGAGCRGASFINFNNIQSLLDAIFDDEQAKIGQTVAGLRVVTADALCSVDVCLLAVNAENEDSVIAKHPRWPGQWFSILPPSKRLLDT